MDQLDELTAPVSTGGGDSGHLTPEELAVFERQLLELREKASGNVAFLRTDSLKPVRPEDEDEDSFDHDFALSVAGSSEQAIREIDDALRRIAEGTFGVCETTGEPIGKARLHAIPYTRLSIKAQAELEGGRHRRRLP